MAGKKLRGYTGPEGGDHSPAPADDVEDTGAHASQDPPRQQAQAEDNEPLAEPTLIQDATREAIANRFKRQRAERRAEAVNPRSHVPAVDGDLDITDPNDPDYIAPEGEDEQQLDGEQDDQSEQPQKRQTAPKAPAQQPAEGEDKRFELKVNGSTFRVSRDELIQYAEFDNPAEAEGIPEIQLQRLAQKQLAANDRLEQAKQAVKSSRQTGARESGTPADDDLSDTDGTERKTRARTPAEQTVELIRQIQFGEPEDAAALVEDLLDGRLNQHTSQLSQEQIVQSTQNAIAAYGQANADLAADEIYVDVLKNQLVRGIVKELRPHLSDDQATYLLNNPETATKAYIGARVDGYKVRPIEDILEEAGTSVRTRFGVERPRGQTQQNSQGNPPPTDRRDAKRMLPRQPAPSGVQQPTRQQQPQNRQAVNSAAIQRMRAARFQTSGP